MYIVGYLLNMDNEYRVCFIKNSQEISEILLGLASFALLDQQVSPKYELHVWYCKPIFRTANTVIILIVIN